MIPVDLDGDGLVELVDSGPMNETQVWFGANVVAAWNAQHPSP